MNLFSVHSGMKNQFHIQLCALFSQDLAYYSLLSQECGAFFFLMKISGIQYLLPAAMMPLITLYVYFDWFQVEIVMGLEEAFQITVDESSAQVIQTVEDAAALIDKLVAEKDA